MKFGILGKKGKAKQTVDETKMIAQASPKKVGVDVDKRREEVLSKGRKFKYPLQYEKHRLVINTIVIGVVAVIALVVAGWVELYKLHDMGDIMYRISMVIPVSVAEVDGEKVRFSDYLRTARSSLSALGQQAGLENGGSEGDLLAMRKQYQRTALTQAEDATYAVKLGKELGLSVSEEEVSAAFDEHRKVGGAERSEESFLKVLETNFGLSKNEYRRMLYLALMRAKVEVEIDREANKLAEEVGRRLAENGGDFEAVRDVLGEKVVFEDTGGLIDNKNVDGGRAGKASGLEIGAQSGKFLSSNGDGYYFVKTVDKNETKVHYVSIYIPFTEFEKELESVREEGLVKEYIKLE